MLLTRLIVKLIAPEVHVKRSRDGTEFEWDTDTIYFDPFDDPQDVGFLRHVRENHDFENPERYCNRLWSILHELGHYFNPDEEEDIEAKTIAALLPYEDAEKYIELQNMYYDSPDEFAATEWAIIWLEEHPHLGKIFSKLLQFIC